MSSIDGDTSIATTSRSGFPAAGAFAKSKHFMVIFSGNWDFVGYAAAWVAVVPNKGNAMPTLPRHDSSTRSKMDVGGTATNSVL